MLQSQTFPGGGGVSGGATDGDASYSHLRKYVTSASRSGSGGSRGRSSSPNARRGGGGGGGGHGGWDLNQLTRDQQERDAAFKAATGKDFPTVVIPAKDFDSYSGSQFVRVPVEHSSEVCESMLGGRVVLTDDQGATYVWPYSWKCNPADDELATPEVRYRKAVMLLMMYNVHLNAFNDLKRNIAMTEIENLLDGRVNKAWLDMIGTRCLRATTHAAGGTVVPDDLLENSQRKAWLRCAGANPSTQQTVQLRNDEDENAKYDAETNAFLPTAGTGGGAAVTGPTTIPGGWEGCALISDVFARQVLTAAVTEMSAMCREWLDGMPQMLRESTNEVVFVRQQVLFTLAARMADAVKDSNVDATLMPQLLAALALSQNKGFFQQPDNTLSGTAAKADREAATASKKTWAENFSRQSKIAATINVQNPGVDGATMREAACADPVTVGKIDGATSADVGRLVLLDRADKARSTCVPSDLNKLREYVTRKNASREDRMVSAAFTEYWQKVYDAAKASKGEGDAAFLDRLKSKDAADGGTYLSDLTREAGAENDAALRDASRQLARQ